MSPQFDYECRYCGEQFNRTSYYHAQLVCPSCKDRNIVKLRDGDCDIFGYNKKEATDTDDNGGYDK